MRCPFLRETEVKFCRHAASRKIMIRGAALAAEKCSSAGFAECPLFQENREEAPAEGPCPFLEKSHAQYCAAAPVTKLVPYSEELLSRCGNGGYRYCNLYLALAQPPDSEENAEVIDGIHVPSWLSYTPNHLWLDRTGEGSYHIGIDAFLAKVLGRVDALSFVTLKGLHRPTAVVTVGGTDLQLVFPRLMLVTDANMYLRANPARLTSDPYASGWLFEATDDPPETPATDEGLATGEQARAWMRWEVDRLSRFVHESLATRGIAADGGSFETGIAGRLDREEALRLFHQFFSPYLGWSR